MSEGGLFGKLFKRGGRDWIILIFSLFLALFMWSIQKLSQNYSAYVKYKVALSSSLEGRVQRAFSDNLLVVRGKSSGFYILQKLYAGDDAEVLEMAVEPKQLHRAGNSSDMFYIPSADLKNKIQEVLGDNLQLEGFATDTLYFSFPQQSYKKVPIAVKSSLRYKSQYMPFTPVVLKPDSILVYGQRALIEKIDSVFTYPVKGERLEKSVSGMIQLVPVEGVKFSVKEVYYSQEIGRYVENSMHVKVGVVNIPAGKSVAVIPQEVELKYRMPFSVRTELLPSDFLVGVDYNDMEQKGNTVQPVLLRSPRHVYAVKIEPHFVECIIN